MRQADSGSLLYVLGKVEGRKLAVFTVPTGQSQKPVAMPHGGWWLCADEHGHVFATSYGFVFEYFHGGHQPIAELQDGNALASSCTVDPKTGDLAVINELSGSHCTFAIYKGARGKPAIHTAKHFRSCQYPAYDGQGNLFFYGNTNEKTFLAELPYGGGAFITVSASPDITDPLDMQWDGEYLAIQEKQPGTEDSPIVIYRVRVSDGKASVVKVLHFKEWRNDAEYFWVAGGFIVAPLNGDALGFWHYPQGGKVVAQIPGLYAYSSFTMSVAPK